jgi:hypothetical protein
MKQENYFAPAIVVYLISASVAALWWASDLNRRVVTIEASSVTAERLARLEVEVRALADSTRELKSSITALTEASKTSR